MADRIGIGHLTFGLAFIVIGAAWLLGQAGLDGFELDAGWLTALAAFALGTAGLVTVIWRVVRGAA